MVGTVWPGATLAFGKQLQARLGLQQHVFMCKLLEPSFSKISEECALNFCISNRTLFYLVQPSLYFIELKHCQKNTDSAILRLGTFGCAGIFAIAVCNSSAHSYCCSV